LKPADVAKGIDLRSLALDFSKVPLPAGSGIEPDQVEAFVDGFFDALDAANDYDDEDTPDIDDDGASERPSDTELAELDAQAAEDDGHSKTPALLSSNLHQPRL
jgi:type IV secretion system protein VirD4